MKYEFDETYVALHALRSANRRWAHYARQIASKHFICKYNKYSYDIDQLRYYDDTFFALQAIALYVICVVIECMLYNLYSALGGSNSSAKK